MTCSDLPSSVSSLPVPSRVSLVPRLSHTSSLKMIGTRPHLLSSKRKGRMPLPEKCTRRARPSRKGLHGTSFRHTHTKYPGTLSPSCRHMSLVYVLSQNLSPLIPNDRADNFATSLTADDPRSSVHPSHQHVHWHVPLDSHEPCWRICLSNRSHHVSW